MNVHITIYQHRLTVAKTLMYRWENSLSQNVHSAPHDRFWTWEFGAAPQSLCSVYAHAETLRCSSAGLDACPVFAACSFDRRCETGGSSYLMVGECPEAQGHRLAHPRQRSLFRTSAPQAFTRSGGARTFSRGWPEWDHCSRRGATHTCLCSGWTFLWLRSSFLVINSFILDRQWLQCSQTMKARRKKKVFSAFHSFFF